MAAFRNVEAKTVMDLINAFVYRAPFYFAALLTLYVTWHLVVHGKDQKGDRMLGTIMVIFPSTVIPPLSNRILCSIHPYRLDLYVVRIDKLFGYPGFLFRQFLDGHPFLRSMNQLSYNSLVVAIALVFLGYVWHRGDEAMSVFPPFILNFALAPPFYMLCPVSGPAYAFSNFPVIPTSVDPHVIALPNVFCNGMPSIHFSCALLVLWYGRRLPAGKLLGVGFAVLTILATLGTGEHYILDLMMSFPYAFMIHKVSCLLLERFRDSSGR